jgi:phage terminase small subunit
MSKVKDRRQRQFCKLMALNNVANLKKPDYEIAIEAGYSKVSAASQASELRNKPKIADAIRELELPLWEKQAMPVQEMISRLSRMGRFDMADYIDAAGDLDIDKLRKSDVIVDEIQIEEIQIAEECIKRKYKIKTNARGAMDSLAKLRGDNAPEKHETTLKGDPENPILPEDAYRQMLGE